MKDLQINPIIKEAQFDELNDEERQLIELAIEGTSRSYAPTPTSTLEPPYN